MPLQHETESSLEGSSDAKQDSSPTRTDIRAPESDEIPARRFEFASGSSQKFWEISLSGNSFTVRFGCIGSAGLSQTKSFADEARARREAERLIAEKLKKGYVEPL